MYKYLFIFSFFLLSCESESVEEEIFEEYVTPKLVTPLYPVDDPDVATDISARVIQGFAHFEDGWFVTQTLNESYLLVNYLNEQGISLFHERIPVNSHGQDLSIETISDNEIILYTTTGTFSGMRESGILKLHVYLPEKINNQRDWSQTLITIDNTFDLDYINCTPSYNDLSQRFYVRSNISILSHSKTALETGNFIPDSHFEINPDQLTDDGGFSMWFQGIISSSDLVYCLTGNDKIGTLKKIFKYDNRGVVLKKYVFNRNNFELEINEKFEPEGLDIIDNEIFFTIMTRNFDNTVNDKFLYKFSL